MAKIGRDGDPVTRAEMLKGRGLYQIKTYKGRPYASKWPRPRGPGTSKVQKAWQAHFSYVACLSKIPDPNTFDNAIGLSKGTGWYYRDVLASAAVGKLFADSTGLRIVTPTAKVHRSSSEALTSGVAKILTPNTLDWDNNAFWSSSVNPTRLTIRSHGLYQVGLRVDFSAVTGSFRDVLIKKNGTTFLEANRIWPATASGMQNNVVGIQPFNDNDYIEAVAQSNAAGVSATLFEFWVMAITPEQVV